MWTSHHMISITQISVLFGYPFSVSDVLHFGGPCVSYVHQSPNGYKLSVPK